MSKRNKNKPAETPATATEIVDAIVKDVEAHAAEVLASIDPAAETAVTAGVIDHDTQLSSWKSEDQAAAEQLEAVVAELEEPPADVPATKEDEAPTLAQLIARIDEEAAKLRVVQIADAVDRRSAFEIDKNGDNDNIHRTLKKVRTQLVTLRAAKLFEAIHVPTGFINRSVHEGSQYNVYAMGKLADIVFGVTDGVVANAINVACMKSLFAFNKAGVPFTMETAKAAASKNYARTLDASVRKHLISHTVAPGTAPTQASSTMQALVTLGVVTTNGSGKNPTYFLQTEAPITKKLEMMLAAA